MTSPQQLEEVQPAFAGRCTKPGKVIVADLRAGAVRGLVAGPGVVDRDPGRLRQSGAQHVASLIEKMLLSMDQQAHDLPRGDRQANGPQLRHQARHGDLPPDDTEPAQSGAAPAQSGHRLRPAAAPRSAARPGSTSAPGDSGYSGPAKQGPGPGNPRSL